MRLRQVAMCDIVTAVIDGDTIIFSSSYQLVPASTNSVIQRVSETSANYCPVNSLVESEGKSTN